MSSLLSQFNQNQQLPSIIATYKNKTKTKDPHFCLKNLYRLKKIKRNNVTFVSGLKHTVEFSHSPKNGCDLRSWIWECLWSWPAQPFLLPRKWWWQCPPHCSWLKNNQTPPQVSSIFPMQKSIFHSLWFMNNWKKIISIY